VEWLLHFVVQVDTVSLLNELNVKLKVKGNLSGVFSDMTVIEMKLELIM
jgi:hypothetical protein